MNDFQITPPPAIAVDGVAYRYQIAKAVRCPFGPIALWVPTKSPDKCGFCDGDGDIEVRGRDHSYADIECPRCDGTGEDEDSSEIDQERPIVWADADGAVVEPDVIYPTGSSLPAISETWLMTYAKAKQMEARP